MILVTIFLPLCQEPLLGDISGKRRPRRCVSCTVLTPRPLGTPKNSFLQDMAKNIASSLQCAVFFPQASLPSTFTYTLATQQRAYHPLRGVRVGEAPHPGPSQQLLSNYFGQSALASIKPQSSAPQLKKHTHHVNAVVIAVINPTSVLNKTQELLALNADIIMMSETSAVSRAQQLMTSALRRHSFKAMWGDAVPSHCHEGQNTEGLRGLAAGVAVATTLPASFPKPKPQPDLLASCRYVEVNIRVGPITVRFITLYGRPSCQVGSREANQELLHAAYEQTVTTKMPTIIAGDLNTPVDSLPAGQALLARGFKEAFHLHHYKHKEILPPTCKGSTRNDTLLLDPILLPYFERAWVLGEEKLFDAHDPLCVQLRVPHAVPCTRRWDLPHSWHQHEPDPKILQDFYTPTFPAMKRQIESCHCIQSLTQAFQDWASGVEDAVHCTLQRQHLLDPIKNPLPGLPKRARGRCRPRTPILRPVVQCARPSRAGDFEPDYDATTVLARMKVRQVRRVESLLRAYRSCQRAGRNAAQSGQLNQEWGAISTAKGYPPCFATWVLRTAHFISFPADFPSISWLEDLLAYLRFDCNALIAQELSMRKDKFKLAVKLDSQFGAARQGFAAVRGPSHPPFLEVPVTREASVVKFETQGPEQCWYTLHKPVDFFPQAIAKIGDVPCRVLEVDQDRVLLQGGDLPHSGTIQQEHIACTSSELSQEFTTYWTSMWARDPPPGSETSRWAAAMQTVESMPSFHVMSLDMMSLQNWKAAIKKMADRRATGICGWRPAEMKILPDLAIELLARLFSKAVSLDLPPHLLVASVSVLAKAEAPEHIRQSRPITVFSTIYRIWSSIAARQILRKWGDTFPRSIMGSLPGRSARDLSYLQQHAIERALLEGRDLYGLSLDIVKCFNCIPWQPTFYMLKKLGVPSSLVECWGRALANVRKYPVFLHSLGHPIASTTGVPEGDPLSVVAMAALCFCAAHLPQMGQVDFRTYVDNWSWQADGPSQLRSVAPNIFSFLSDLQLQVDWSKTYTWSTSKKGRAWLQGKGQDMFPTDVRIAVTSARTELGTPFQFSRNVDLATRNARLQEGQDRLRRLAKQPRPVQERALIIQTSVWPATFWGAEGHCHSCAEVACLRSAAAYALIGEHKTMSPLLALGAVTDKVQDPQLFLVEQQLQQLRRALWHDTATGLGVLEDISKGCSRSAFGPASALRLGLPRLQLKLDSNGILISPDLVSIDLFTCNRYQIRRLLQKAWTHYVAEHSSHRNGLHEELLPDPVATGKLLQMLKPTEALVVARHIAGGFQSGAAKSLWEPEVSEQCPLCGKLDTKEHRILHCPATQAVRDHWSPYVDFAVGRYPHWVHGPYMVIPQNVEIPRLVLSRRVMPTFNNPVALNVAATLPRLRVFTDGSCMNPQSMWGRLASWAVILDTSQSDHEIPTYLNQWRLTGQVPQCFIVIAQGGVPGEQSINRAETCALTVASQFVSACQHPTGEVLTDSLFAMAEHARVLAEMPCLYPDIANVLAQSAPSKLQLKKVKAHQDPSKLSGLELWECAGNAFADCSAKGALQLDHQFLRDTLQEIADEESNQKAALHLFHRYLLDLSHEEWRLKQQRGPPSSQEQREASGMGVTHRDREWHALTPLVVAKFPLPPFSNTWIMASSWPPFFTVPLWNYLSSLEWQTSPDQGPGVSGVELLVDFVVVSVTLPPLRDAQGNGYKQVLDSPLHPPTTIRAWVQAVLEAARQLSRFCQATLLPKKRLKVFSLKTIGFTACRSGLQLRPKWANAGATLEVLKKVLIADSILPLIAYVKHSQQPPAPVASAIVKEYSSYTTNERDRLARKLRGGRGRCAV